LADPPGSPLDVYLRNCASSYPPPITQALLIILLIRFDMEFHTGAWHCA